MRVVIADPDSWSTRLIIQSMPGYEQSRDVIDKVSGVVLWRDDDHAVLISPNGARVEPTDVLITVTMPGDNLLTAAGLTVDHRSAVVVDRDGEISIIDLQSRLSRSVVPAPSELQRKGGVLRARDVAINAAAELVAMVKPAHGDQRRRVEVIEVASGSTIGIIANENVDSVEFAGSSLLLGRLNHPLEVWDQRGARARQTIADLVYPTGNGAGTIVAEARDSTVDIVDLSAGTLMGTLVGPRLETAANQRTSVAFSADDSHIVTVTTGGFLVKDGVLVVRNLDPESLMDSACVAAGSPLTQQEVASIAGLTSLPVPCGR